MLLASYCAGPALLQDVLNRRLLFKQTGSSSTVAKPSPIISSFLELSRKKPVDAAKICGGAENVKKAKTETQQTSRVGLLGFYYFRHLYSRQRVGLLTHCMSGPSMGNSICTAH